MPTTAAKPARQQKAVIIGAGAGGLATANLLAKAGYHVEVYEQAARAGGRAGLLKSEGFSFDTGPSWLLMQTVFQQYYRLLGRDLHDELDLVRLDPAYKVFYESHDPITITSDIKRDAATFENIEPGSGSRLEAYVRRSSRDYRLAINHFLYSNFVKRENLRHIDILRHSPALLKLATVPIHSYVSKQFTDPRLQQILEYQMVFLGSSPYKAPAIYNLMSALDFDEGVYYPRGGMYRFIENLQSIGESLGVQYHFKSPVDKIVSFRGRATGIVLKSSKLIEADIVISNADLYFTETKLLNPADQSYPEIYWKTKTPSPSALLIYMGIRGAIPEFEHHNLLFLDDWEHNFDAIQGGTMPDKASIYISKASATDPDIAPQGDENVFVLVPIPAGVKLGADEEERYAHQYLTQIKDVTGVDLAGRATQMTVYGPDYFEREFHAWQYSMLGPAHTLAQSAFFRPATRSRKLPNLFYVGAGTRPGIGLPMCLISAELVYKQLVGDTSAGPSRIIENIGHESWEKTAPMRSFKLVKTRRKPGSN